jgi:small conductance mechanosensitive channel
MSLRTACLLIALLLCPSMPLPSFAGSPALASARAGSTAAPASSETATSLQLDRRLRAIDALHDVTATVSGDIARLDGKVVGEGDRRLAEQIASQLPGISRVDNRIQLSSKLGDRFEAAWRAAIDKLLRLLAATPLLLVAIAIVLLAAWIGRVVPSRMQWLSRFRSPNPYMDGLIRGIVRSLILLAGILLALDLLGATALVGAVLGSAGVVGLVLGFAFKDIAENYIAGILLSLRRPFAPGDHVQIENREGKVVALTSRSTLLMTLDGIQLRLPNALVFKAVILNSSHNPKRRFDFNLTIDPRESIRQAQTLAIAEIGKVEGVLEDPKPSWQVHEYTQAGIVLRFFGWVDQHHSDLGKVRSEAIRVVKAAYAKAAIFGPRLTSHVVLHREPAALAETKAELVHDRAHPDTSVNRDIDRQLAAAQNASEGDNLLDNQGTDGNQAPASG